VVTNNEDRLYPTRGERAHVQICMNDARLKFVRVLHQNRYYTEEDRSNPAYGLYALQIIALYVCHDTAVVIDDVSPTCAVVLRRVTMTNICDSDLFPRPPTSVKNYEQSGL
jgi:hypothetical protein